MSVRVKICGVTRPEDARLAASEGADAIGLVFAESQRRVDPAQAVSIALGLPPFFPVVGVFRDQPADLVRAVLAACPLTHLQFHGVETPDFCTSFGRPFIRGFRLVSTTDLEAARSFAAAYPDARILVDASTPGSGSRCDWDLARVLAAEMPIILAGGLTPENVAAAIRCAGPAAVDVSTGVESKPGVKSPDLVRAFLGRCRQSV